ncbi:hypothetical protein GJ496_001606 [Pomphorhynchus laevis]|nr:hypothetical protein GJ496_001606 [Pomphorhynchus laevis]
MPMIVVHPSHYCVIVNPVIRDVETGAVEYDYVGQAKLRWGDKEYRFEQQSFPLYPGEILDKPSTKMTIILPGQALHLRALVDFIDEDGIKRIAGSEWLLRREGRYKPRKEVKEVTIITAIILNENNALHLKSTISHKDQFGKFRKAGMEWLLTNKDVESYIPEIGEIVTCKIQSVILNSYNYCTILNPVNETFQCQIGIKKIVRGPCSFFLHPAEKIDGDIENVHQLTGNDGLVLRCVDTMKGREIGDMWLLRGPCEFVPTEAVKIVHTRSAFALAENEGIYVKNVDDGKVRSVVGMNYMLNEQEELWDKHLPQDVSDLLSTDALAGRSARITAGDLVTRKSYQVVSFKIPHNSASQIYDYRLNKSRVVFGPELVILEPDEQFTLLSLSAGVPKLANSRKALCLLLGPDYFEDVFTIETADHARLSLRVSLNWLFSIDKQPEEEKALVASRIRGAVSSVPFDHFHKHSADIIHLAVFGKNENGVVNNSFTFPQNFLTITSLDIISLEPVDQKTRDALQRTVQLAIEITTNAQEASAKHEAIRLQQEAEARQLRQRLIDSLAAGKEKKLLISQEAENAELETCCQSVAEAKSQALAGKIEKESALEQVKLEIEALKVQALNEIEQMRTIKQLEAEHVKRMNDLEIEKNQKQSEIEINKFKEQVLAIGKETLVAVANAGPELKVKLLQALGLQSALITDGTNPINLFNTASGLIDVIEKDTKLTKIKQI